MYRHPNLKLYHQTYGFKPSAYACPSPPTPLECLQTEHERKNDKNNHQPPVSFSFLISFDSVVKIKEKLYKTKSTRLKLTNKAKENVIKLNLLQIASSCYDGSDDLQEGVKTETTVRQLTVDRGYKYYFF